VGLVYDPKEVTGVTTVRPGVIGVSQMVSEPTLTVSRAYRSIEKDTVVYGSGTWIHTHNVWVLWKGHNMVHMLLTGRMIHVCQYWMYGRSQEGTFLAWG
jgi:hypothetical protein